MFAIVTTVWKRPELTSLMLRHTKQVCAHRNDILFYAVGSEQELSKNLVGSEGWVYLESPNTPLNQKWNNLIQTLPRDIQGIFILGSDDFVAREYIDKALSAGYDVCGSNSCYFLDVSLKAGCRFRYDQKTRLFGAGMFVSKKTLDLLNWTPWKGTPISSSLDRRLMSNIHSVAKTLKMKAFSDNDIIIDVKGTGVNISKFIHFRSPGNACDVWSILQTITSEDIFNQIKAMSDQLYRGA